MTEETVRAVFFKNYSGRDLDETLRVSVEEIMLAVIKESVEQPESLPEIVEDIVVAKGHATLFMRMTNGTNFTVPANYLIYFDTIRKAMVDVVKYMRDNLETMDQWFREKFSKEDLEIILTEIASTIERSAERPMNVRAFHSGELKLYEEFFNAALIGIIGLEQFKKFMEKYNKCTVVLRQCQAEYRSFGDQIEIKES